MSPWNDTGETLAGPQGPQGPPGSNPTYSSDQPRPAGIAHPGLAEAAARSDHVHPIHQEVFVVACSDESTYLTPGTKKISFLMPFNGTLETVRASVAAAPVGSPLMLDLRIDGVSCLNPKLQIDSAETSSTTAAQQALIATPLLPDGSEVSVDINQVGSTIAGAGLKVYLYVKRS